ncbi:MAG: hypothetical protein IJD91_08765 [Clostridia bacterium]|nr:hypothetical protein [Clostridia bacterium]
MKKFLSIILAIAIVLSLAACGKKESEETLNQDDTQTEAIENEATEEKEPEKDSEKEDEKEAEKENEKEAEKDDKKDSDKKPVKEPEKKPEKEPEKKPETKPEIKPEVVPETTPEVKPEAKPEVKPEAKPEVKPEASKTVGQTLLSDFKAKASDSASALSIAEKLATNETLAIGCGAMPVSEGYLTGFDNTEIKGFKEGAMFAPMIGTIPFVGYVFTLADGTNASDFIATLKSAANLRWNICTTAEEMVAGTSGNKVFFVMCPKSFEDAE